MNITASDLQHYVIQPTLDYLGMHSDSAVKLLLSTAAQESGFNPFKQPSAGVGIYQISPEQHRSVWDNFLAFKPDLASKVRGLASQHQFLKTPDEELRTNLSYSTAIAWSIYLQCDHQLPEASDDRGLGEYWRVHFRQLNQTTEREDRTAVSVGSNAI